MSSYFASSFLSTSALQIALLFFVAGTLILLRSLYTQDRQIGEQKLALAQLGEQLQECVTQQAVTQEKLSCIREQCLSLTARQQLVEKHGSDVQRIDLAMRMLKRGAGNAETLHDLGLSSSEIKLLLRLHSKPAGITDSSSRSVNAVQPLSKSSSKAPTSRPKAVPEKSTHTVDSDSDNGVSMHVSEQGQELAKLFKARATA